MIAQYDGFYSAVKAREIALGQSAVNNDVLSEINALRALIHAAASVGDIEVTITNSTLMTQSNIYFEGWTDPHNNSEATHRKARHSMDQVISYFTRLGYVVRRSREGVFNRFEWNIRW